MRYSGPICRYCRREGISLCDKHKCAAIKRPTPPGQHGNKRLPKTSDYAKQLREKQKAKRIFGLTEKQMRKYYAAAVKSKGITGDELLKNLEKRLDNAVFRSGIARTRRQARQLVSHGIVTLNGRRVTIPSIVVQEGDEFGIREKNKSMPAFENFAKRKVQVPGWLTVDTNAISAKVSGSAQKEDLEQSIDTQMIIEFYSRT
ncbi:30S ribosomal protein S4 [Candidatus Peregrinibacteria bacterium CG11_big_fil_rev_8_21_14_0_20_46_8]|nr:MAG: 30S ribosomal protein S4 [Candidatus Peregrinibacteria bacterium CG11_big_fil_rev_8_21_14_0_20_46_8]